MTDALSSEKSFCLNYTNLKVVATKPTALKLNGS